jgi:hypothetical protein
MQARGSDDSASSMRLVVHLMMGWAYRPLRSLRAVPSSQRRIRWLRVVSVCVAATFMNEQGREFTNYATEEFVTGIAKQVPRLNLTGWEQSRTLAMAKMVEADLIDARNVGFHDFPSFRTGLTGERMKNFVGRHLETYRKFIVRTTSSGERYIAGISSAWQHPVSLVDAIDLKKAVGELI